MIIHLFRRNIYFYMNRLSNLFIPITIYVTFLILMIVLINSFTKENEQPEMEILKNELDQNDISKILFSSVKILCLIFSSRKEIFNRAVHINATWARRCNKVLFLTKHELKLPYLDLRLPDERNQLWNKLRIALTWAYENELNSYDFFLRADDDSYYVMENLRFMLLSYDPNLPYYFGARFKYNFSSGYMSGGAGIILSREALKQIVTSLDNPAICPPPSTIEYHDDKQLGVCVKNLNITSVDTRDKEGRHRMLPWSPATHFLTFLEPQHFDYLYYPYKQDKQFECCADYMISFHYVYNETIYLLDFLFYHTNVIGRSERHMTRILMDGKITSSSILEQLKSFSKTDGMQ